MAVIHERFEDSAPRPKTEPVYEPSESVASVLRRTRDDLGQDLHTVAEVLRIRHTYLEAIEDGAYDRLPGAAYVIGFLRTYADFLGLDGNGMVERFKDESESEQRKKTELDFPDMPSESRIPRAALLLAPALILAAAIGAWFVWPIAAPKLSELLPTWSSQPSDVQAWANDPAEEMPPPPAERIGTDPSAAALEPTPAPAATTPAGAESGDRVEVASKPKPAPPAQPAAETEPAATSRAAAKPKPAPPALPAAETEPNLTSTAAESVPTPKLRPSKPLPQAVETAPRGDAENPAVRTLSQTSPQSAAQTSTPSSRAPARIREEITMVEIPAPPRVREISREPGGLASRIYGQHGQDTRIVIRATQESWVQVRNRHDVPLLTRVLRPGDIYYVPNRDGLTLVTGNAGGLEIEVDRVRLPPLGSVGSVRREIALDPTRLLTGTAAAQ